MRALAAPTGLGLSAMLLVAATRWPLPSAPARDLPASATSELPGVQHVSRADDGLFYVTLRVDGRPVRFLVDTGATHVVLTHRDAVRLGVAGRSGSSELLRGTVATRRVRQVRLDRVAWRNGAAEDVPAVVMGADTALRTSLLGQSLLRRLRVFRIEDESLALG
jgi:aspartyl protease family protein